MLRSKFTHICLNTLPALWYHSANALLNVSSDVTATLRSVATHDDVRLVPQSWAQNGIFWKPKHVLSIHVLCMQKFFLLGCQIRFCIKAKFLSCFPRARSKWFFSLDCFYSLTRSQLCFLLRLLILTKLYNVLQNQLIINPLMNKGNPLGGYTIIFF